MSRFIHLLVMIIFPACLFCQSPHFPTEKLDSFITKAMNDWHLMGLAIAIVKKDSVIFAKGYGYRDYMNKLPVTENTVFPIASCSKTFTAALMGIAEKDGKIQYCFFPVCHSEDGRATILPGKGYVLSSGRDVS